MDGWKVSWMDGPATKTAPATKCAGVEAQQAINGPIRNTQLRPPTAVAGSQSAEAQSGQPKKAQASQSHS